MDTLNNDNDDISMADSNNNSGSDNDREDASNDDNDDINHDRLKELSNYADQNWSIYRSRYRTLSNLSEVEREEIRDGETRMVSHMFPRHYVGTGISLNWGEYYVPHSEMDDNNDDEEESSLSSFEEAEEIDDEELDREVKQAASISNNETSQIPFEINFDQLDTNVEAPDPTLMGMPDIILEKILHYSTDHPSKVCIVERVCKRIRRLTTGEDFWLRHPLSTKYRSSILGRTNKLPDNCLESRSHLYKILKKCKARISDHPFTRQLAFELEAVGRIRHSQCNHSNRILDVLRDEGDCVADTFRTLSADILSRMNLGPEVHFRLRGDTIGYICELLQGYIVDRLEIAILLAISRHRVSVVVQRDDIALAFRRQSDIFSCSYSQVPRRCNVATGDHGKSSTDDCSCSLPSSSGIIWRWPDDDCHDVLPLEAGRRIIRRLAYIAGVVNMSNEAFILVETEYLHALGVLLVCAYESSVDMETKMTFLGVEDSITYEAPHSAVDMFSSPPPPFQNEQQLVYTIVPGHIRTAAEQRGITPYKVYGAEWVASSGFTKEEELDIEKSYYYEDEDDDEESDSDSDIEGKESNKLDDSNDSDSEAEIEEGEDEEDIDMDLDMNTYEDDLDNTIDPYLHFS